ncbi:putative long chain acyl-CoA synthetase 7; peroxisomal [Paratrimastix pyriformis]|uniref:Long chain acyl-CoA synthetase 7 n=1 Tax=Paratrimastix pyriformis TaxID=342808 RepID=A0ABQ8UVN1_9EUKA|nr:putative long chain acyl-CoA synthetase 7; peroxisomal [Paratrimastix pyriformis]
MRFASTHYPRRPALGTRAYLPDGRRGPYEWETYDQVFRRIESFGRGLRRLGMNPGDPVVVLGPNGPEWVVADMAASMQGLPLVPLPPSASPELIAQCLALTQACCCICAVACLPSVNAARGQDPAGHLLVVLMDGAAPDRAWAEAHPPFRPHAAVPAPALAGCGSGPRLAGAAPGGGLRAPSMPAAARRAPRSSREAAARALPPPEAYEWTFSQVEGLGQLGGGGDLGGYVADPDEMCTIGFTAGTEGPPKPVMASHAGLIGAVTVIRRYCGDQAAPADVYLCHLALHGTLSRICCAATLSRGHMVGFSQGSEHHRWVGLWGARQTEAGLMEDLRMLRPTVLLGGPATFAAIHATVRLPPQAPDKAHRPSRPSGASVARRARLPPPSVVGQMAAWSRTRQRSFKWALAARQKAIAQYAEGLSPRRVDAALGPAGAVRGELDRLLGGPGGPGPAATAGGAGRPRELTERGLPTPFWDWAVFGGLKAILGDDRLRLMLCGTGPPPPGVATFMKTSAAPPPSIARPQRPPVRAYCLEETLGPVCLTSWDSPTCGHVGPPAGMNEVQIVDVPQLAGLGLPEAPAGCGEIRVRGPCLFKGYYKHPEMTQDCFEGDWFRTGDVGYWDTAGQLHLVGRLSNVFSTSEGRPVCPERLEQAYLGCPLVRQLVVFGGPDQPGVAALVVPHWARLAQIDSTPVSHPAVRKDNLAAPGAPQQGFGTWRTHHMPPRPTRQPLQSGPAARANGPRQAPAAVLLEALLRMAQEARLRVHETVTRVLVMTEDWTRENGLLTLDNRPNRLELLRRFGGISTP